jgi:hypothetical protein
MIPGKDYGATSWHTMNMQQANIEKQERKETTEEKAEPVEKAKSQPAVTGANVERGRVPLLPVNYLPTHRLPP